MFWFQLLLWAKNLVALVEPSSIHALVLFSSKLILGLFMWLALACGALTSVSKWKHLTCLYSRACPLETVWHMTQSQVLSKASPYGGATCRILQRRVLRHFSHKSSQQIGNTEWQVCEKLSQTLQSLLTSTRWLQLQLIFCGAKEPPSLVQSTHKIMRVNKMAVLICSFWIVYYTAIYNQTKHQLEFHSCHWRFV